MLRGLWKLVWLEIKIFVREPLGLIGTVVIPVLVFVVMSRLFEGPRRPPSEIPPFASRDLPVFIAILIALNAVLSLIAIVSIYRESGILKRLRATPLRPHTILIAHVVVKLLLTAVTLAAMALAGRRFFPMVSGAPMVSFAIALVFSTLSILSMGFVIASVVPTARFAQPIGALILYPMLGLSGLFLPVEVMPPALQTIARMLPLTYAVSLLRGIWHGDPWTAHGVDLLALILFFLGCTLLSAKVFRWE